MEIFLLCNCISTTMDIILAILQSPVESNNVMPMEQLPINNDGGQGYGFILYQTKLSQFPTEILIEEVLDRAQVMEFSSIVVYDMYTVVI